MPTVTTLVGALLTLLGLGGYAGSGQASKTALIPAGFGVALVALGLAGRAEGLRPHAMHGAAAIGLLGVLGSACGLPAALRLARGEQVARPAAAAAQAAMFALCLSYVGVSVRSFIAARRARRREI
jgi:hypothetical protein